MNNLLQSISNTIGGFFSPIVTSLGNTYNQHVQNSKQLQQNAIRSTAGLTGYLNNQYQQLQAKPISVAPIAPYVQELFTKGIQTVSKTPLTDFTPSAAAFRELAKYTPFKSPTVGQGLDFLRSVTIQPIARIGAEGSMTLANDRRQIKSSDFTIPGIAEFLYGKQPLQNWSDPKRPSREFLKGLGANQQTVNTLSPFLIGLGIGFDLTPFTAGKGKIAKEGAEQVAKGEAVNVLKGLLTYEDELARMGLGESERAKYSYQKAREVFQWDQATAERVLGQARQYATEKKKVFDKIFARWIGEKDAAKVTGVNMGTKFTHIPENLGWDVIRFMEDGNVKVGSQVVKFAQGVKREYDGLYKEAQRAGLSPQYVRQYVTHIWANTDDEIARAMQGASQRFRFAKERKFFTYEEGITNGLTPKYRNPSQILAEYTQRLEIAKANIKFIEELKKEGLVVDAAIGANRPGFTQIIANGFPVSESKDYEGKLIKNAYYAPTEIAQVINRLFETQEESNLGKAVGFTANVSSKLQDWHLAGGLPGTPLNAFATMAGLGKEYLAGRIVSPTVNFIKSFKPGYEKQFAIEHSETLKAMSRNNIPVSMYGIEDLVGKSFVKQLLGGEWEAVWQKTFNDPTFKRFIPSLQVTFFEDMMDKAVQSGKSKEVAEEIATKATKAFYGLLTSDRKVRSDKLTNDLATTVFFAPKYRRAILTVWSSALKNVSPIHYSEGAFKLNNPLSLENRTTTQFLIGSVLAYVAYNKLNEHFMGNPMYTNNKGNEYNLMIPEDSILHNGSKTIYRIPFLPSLLTVPRAIAGMAQHGLQGDGQQVLKDARGLTSTFLQAPIGLLTNENYFGQPIYGEDGQGIGRYLFENYSHPYMGAVAEQMFPKKEAPPLSQTIIKALELPIRFTTTDKLSSAKYYTVRDEALKLLNDEERQVYQMLLKKNDGNLRQTMYEAQLRLSYPKVLRIEGIIAKETAKNGFVDPFYQLNPLAQKTILTIQSLPPGSNEKSQLTQQNIGFLQQYWTAREQYFNELGMTPKDDGRPALTPELQQKVDTYYSLPKGTGQRSQFANANPDLVKYWNEKGDFTNQQRAELGLPVTQSSYLSSNFSNIKKRMPKLNRYASLKTKKLSVKLPKVKKLVKLKIPKLKVKATAYKLPKTRKISFKGVYA